MSIRFGYTRVSVLSGTLPLALVVYAVIRLHPHVVYLGGDPDRVLHVVLRRAGSLRAGVLEAVACAPESAERAKRPDAGTELGDDSALYRDVPAAAGRPELLGFE